VDRQAEFFLPAHDGANALIQEPSDFLPGFEPVTRLLCTNSRGWDCAFVRDGATGTTAKCFFGFFRAHGGSCHILTLAKFIEIGDKGQAHKKPVGEVCLPSSQTRN
jgi:hypothetical protein